MPKKGKGKVKGRMEEGTPRDDETTPRGDSDITPRGDDYNNTKYVASEEKKDNVQHSSEKETTQRSVIEVKIEDVLPVAVVEEKIEEPVVE